MSLKTRELELRLERVEQQLRLLQRVSRYVSREIPLADALQNIVSLVVEFMASDSCLLYLADGDHLVLCASSAGQADAIGHLRLAFDEGLTGWVAREKRLLAISREAYLDPRFKLFRDLPEDTYEAFLSAPVIAKGKVAGVINVQHKDQHSHDGNEMELLNTIGEQIGSLLVTRSLHELPARFEIGDLLRTAVVGTARG